MINDVQSSSSQTLLLELGACKNEFSANGFSFIPQGSSDVVSRDEIFFHCSQKKDLLANFFCHKVCWQTSLSALANNGFWRENLVINRGKTAVFLTISSTGQYEAAAEATEAAEAAILSGTTIMDHINPEDLITPPRRPSNERPPQLERRKEGRGPHSIVKRLFNNQQHRTFYGSIAHNQRSPLSRRRECQQRQQQQQQEQGKRPSVFDRLGNHQELSIVTEKMMYVDLGVEPLDRCCLAPAQSDPQEEEKEEEENVEPQRDDHQPVDRKCGFIVKDGEVHWVTPVYYEQPIRDRLEYPAEE